MHHAEHSPRSIHPRRAGTSGFESSVRGTVMQLHRRAWSRRFIENCTKLSRCTEFKSLWRNWIRLSGMNGYDDDFQGEILWIERLWIVSSKILYYFLQIFLMFIYFSQKSRINFSFVITIMRYRWCDTNPTCSLTVQLFSLDIFRYIYSFISISLHIHIF